MKIKRTANAGVLLSLDGISILLDGVCKELYPYLGTPHDIQKELLESPPDVVAFTHMHDDHYDEKFAKTYEELMLRSVLGPGLSVLKEIGEITVCAVPTRHIGKNDVPHASFVISGSKCVWFLGDASPLQWKGITGLKKPDVLIVPYAYAISESAWRITQELGATHILVLHLPKRDSDEYGLWNALIKTTQNGVKPIVLNMGEEIEL